MGIFLTVFQQGGQKITPWGVSLESLSLGNAGALETGGAVSITLGFRVFVLVAITYSPPPTVPTSVSKVSI